MDSPLIDIDVTALYSEIDQAIANEVFRLIPASPQAKAFVAHMAYALRRGHICVTPSGPKPSELWRLGEVEADISSYDTLDAFILEGSSQIPQEIIGKEIVCDGGRFYFQRYWNEETELLEHCCRLMSEGHPFKIDEDLLSLRLTEAKELLEEQKQAIRMVIQHPLSILAGGPGTGKTYTVGRMLRLLWECMPAETRDSFRIAVAAPTGKAAAQLQGSLMRALEGTSWHEHLAAKTLHSLLGYTPFSRDRRPRLTVQLLIIDESSMVDVKMMTRLLRAVPSETHVLFVGDPNQLPAIDVGSVFSDLISAFKRRGCYTHLKTCLRAELEGILHFADAVNQGREEEALACLSEEGLEAVDCGFEYQDLEKMEKLYGSYFDFDRDPAKALDQQQAFSLLTPMRRGLFGVDRVNRFFFERKKSPYVPIMVTGNAPDLDLFNGKLGLLINDEQAIFRGDKGEIRTLSSLLIPKYELAYCLSVHKSQGSEFDHVVLLLPDRSEIFGRQVLYTGVTRGRRKVSLWGSCERIKSVIQYCPKRGSGLSERLE